MSKKKSSPFVQMQTIKLVEDHGWRAAPGYKLMVIGRGDLRFEYPAGWVHEFTDHSVKVRNAPHPADTMVLEVSALRTPALMQMKPLPSLAELLVGNLTRQGQIISLSQVRTMEAPGLEIAWTEYRKTETDPQTGQPREAIWRQAHAHAGRFHSGAYTPFGIITFGFWTDHAEAADAVWQHVLQSLVMGQTVVDPRRGPTLH